MLARGCRIAGMGVVAEEAVVVVAVVGVVVDGIGR